MFLRKLELNWDNLAYVHFFGVKVAPFLDSSDWWRSVQAQGGYLPAEALERIPALEELHISFRSTTYCGDSPWRYFHELGAQSDVAAWQHTCQKTLVDMIMAFAFEHVEHIPHVRLVGYVKTVTKAKWERILRESYLNPVLRTSHVKMVEDTKATITKLPAEELPPKCFCPKVCADCTAGSFIKTYERDCAAEDTEDHSECHHKLSEPAYKKALTKIYHNYRFDFDDTEPITNPALTAKDPQAKGEYKQIQGKKCAST